MVTLSLPWYDPNLYSQDLFKLIFATKYPALSDETDPYLKYLISIMLKKDPIRRANLTDILKLDFVYDKITKIIKKYNWDNVKEFEGIKNFENDIRPCYLFFKLFTQDEFDILLDACKLCSYSLSCSYKTGYFTYPIRCKKGDVLLETFENSKEWENESLSYKEEKPKNLFKKILMSGAIIPLSHTIKDIKNEEEVDKFVDDMILNPSNYYFKFPLMMFENVSGNIDNPQICSYTIYNDKKRAMSTIRISLSYVTTNEEISKFLNLFKSKYRELDELMRNKHE
jgi:hypothetical protein